MAICFLKQKTSTYTFKRYENFTEGLVSRQEPGIEQADQPERLSRPRDYLAATHVGNYALFGGGKYNNMVVDGSVNSKDVDVYDQSLNRTTATELSEGRHHLAATSIRNEYALFGGGIKGDEKLNVVDAYDSNLNKVNAQELYVPRGYLTATHVGKYALFAGGIGTQVSAIVDAFDTPLNRVTPPSLSTPRYNLASTHVGNHALFGGGTTTNITEVDTVDAYDQNLNMTTITPLSISRSDLAATHVGDYALFAGGYHQNISEDRSQYSKRVDAFDSLLNLVTAPIETLSYDKKELASAHIEKYAIFAGGRNNPHIFRTVDVYGETLDRTSTQNLSGNGMYVVGTHVGEYALFAPIYPATAADSDQDQVGTVDAYRENQPVCDFPVVPSSIYKFEPFDEETTAESFSKITVNYPVNGYVKYITTTLT